MPIPVQFTGCHRTSSDAAGVGPPVIGCRALPVRCRTSDVGPPVIGCRTPPVRSIECRRSSDVGRRRSGAVGRRMLLCCLSGLGWPKPLHVARQPPFLVQVTLNSLCSTHRHKDNNFCSTLYIVGALFDLFMWDIS